MQNQSGRKLAFICLLSVISIAAQAQEDTSGMSLPYRPGLGTPGTLQQEDVQPVAPGTVVPQYENQPRSSDDTLHTSTSVDLSGDEPPPFDPGVDDDGVPVDGGLSLLLATGLGIGGRALLRRKQTVKEAGA